ncbi:MAG: carbohydrate kinase [Candidatus Latescibacteria bacterium]|jgi:xylulokinase|nr:carbohydrate kinase [Candidatus Latescibacterota bacterium]
MYLLGYDVGSSSIKATLLNAGTGAVIASVTSPDRELEIIAKQPGWAEQRPEIWWDNVRLATGMILSDKRIDADEIHAIGISYQMHGLVIVDKNRKVLRPSIIWCDSRAVETGERAFREIGEATCLEHLLNSPGNFTASKLKWVMENEPDIYSKVYKAMLPGDYIAMKMTDEIKTTPSGLSEGIMWDFQNQNLADIVLDYYNISPDVIPDVAPTFSIQGEMTVSAAQELGLKPGIKVAYRAGDQPNNAFSLNVLNPGEIAANAGTSGVVYGVSDMANYDLKSRVNPFVHVSHTPDNPRYGILLCVNGTGILNSWLKHNCVTKNMPYKQMNELALQIPVGSEGLSIIPYGNGAERTLENRDIGASIHNMQFNIHDRRHILRAAQEGIVFAFNYGLGIMREMGVHVQAVRAGDTNMFLSPIFREAFATITDAVVELYNTDGSQGAARGAGIGSGLYKTQQEAFIGLDKTDVIHPKNELVSAYSDAYERWLAVLHNQ